MPAKAQDLWRMIGYEDAVGSHSVDEATDPIPVRKLVDPKMPFAKLEDDQVAKLDATLRRRVDAANAKGKGKEVTVPEDTVTMEDFSRMQLRVARVLAAEPVKGSKKLFRLQIDIGDEQRQIVSGIAPFYKPEELVGRDVVVIVNLQPAKIFGVESRGMILAAGDGASLLVPLRPVPPGTPIR
jgi:methionyl-tRNA synthetase